MFRVQRLSPLSFDPTPFMLASRRKGITMRIAAILFAATCVAAPASAQTGSRGPGVDLSIGMSGGALTLNHEYGYDGGLFIGIIARDPLAEAERACTSSGGAFSTRSGGAFCTMRMPVRGRPMLTRFNSAREAENACSSAGGSFSNRAGGLSCTNPRRPIVAGMRGDLGAR